MKILPPVFLELRGDAGAPLAVLGLPYDGTCSYRPGSRFGPRAIRDASWGLETYSPELDGDLQGSMVADLGDLDLPFGNTERALGEIGAAAREVAALGKRLLCLGGEHLVTLPLAEACREVHEGLVLLHFDAHSDLREDYLGERLSHASVIRRCVDRLGPDRVCQFGVRSGTRHEFDWMREHGTLYPATGEGVRRALARFDGPVYLSVDLDVFDPSVVPGTGTPEPGGIDYRRFVECMAELLTSGRAIAGADVVELSPPYDPSGISAVLGAKVARDLLIVMGARG